LGVKPLATYEWRERDGEEAREGYAAATGVVVDGAAIGTTKPVWIRTPDEDDEEDSDVSAAYDWQRSNTNRHRERQALAELIAADVAAYLADIDTNAHLSAAEFAANQLRAAVWFGISGCIDSENAADFLNPDWNPLAWTWKQTAAHIAEHVAEVTANDIADFEPSDEYKTSVTILAGMFAIPMDMIATRAMDTLYTATRAEAMDADTANGGADDTTDTDARAKALYLEHLLPYGTIRVCEYSFDFDSTLHWAISQQIQGDAANRRDILRAVSLAGPLLILVKGNVQNPMQAVFNAPVLADGFPESLPVA